MAKRVRLRVGDLVEIPIDDQRSCYGQVFDISQPGKFYFGVFDAAFSTGEPPESDAIARCDLLLVAETLDALLFHGRWHVVGNTGVQADVPYPWFRVAFGSEAKPYVANYSRTVIRPAQPHELALVDHRATFAPIILDQAVKARFGIGDWRPEFDQLTAAHVRYQAALFAST